MRIAKILGSVLLTFMGVVWTLQGLGASYVPTSFMTNAPQWILIGVVTATSGITLAIRSLRKQG